jgi:RNA polymerase sigma-70 factor (ECF subfamily)
MTGRPRRATSVSAHEAYTPDPDLDAVRAAQRDRSAFGVLYRRYLEPVYGYAFYALGDHHDAEDATARTFLQALRAIHRFEERDASFRAWLFTIAHRTVLNALRGRRRRSAAPLDAAPDPPATDADPAGLVARAEEVRRVRGALASLPEERRTAVLLRFVDGLSAREIGAVLGRSEGAVRVLLHRAMREMAERLDV